MSLNDFFPDTPETAKRRGKNKGTTMADGTALTAKAFPLDKLERFINLVRSQSTLWDSSLSIEKRDAQCRERAWVFISSSLGVKAEICKAKFKSLRTQVSFLK